MYDIEPWAFDLHHHGVIFCFMGHNDAHHPADFDDPAAECVWFTNQLRAAQLLGYRRETEKMSSVMRGLAVTNSPIIRTAHNSLARPSDIRASLNNITVTTSDAFKQKEEERKADAKPPPAKCGNPVDPALLQTAMPAFTWPNRSDAKVGLEDEFGKRVRANTDHVKRRFDDEPFIREYLQRAHREVLLNALLDRDDDGEKRRGGSRSRSRRGRRGDHERWGWGHLSNCRSAPTPFPSNIRELPPAPSNALPEISDDELTVKYLRILGQFDAKPTRTPMAGYFFGKQIKGTRIVKTRQPFNSSRTEKMNGSIMYLD
ncbi:hypothetical protein GALMADRAFT_148095 [Galerina marginata CBS 339.88]|uniref:Uncharacterized protein n=1 Tax=Galerina marginata (strain CBS 339.88) TaxID=685588 RepID=A0A067S5V7_GALM3|nr:hypothetical protein GALMADRAFT_148095 [Galerina marginata CBS 339.88]